MKKKLRKNVNGIVIYFKVNAYVDETCSGGNGSCGNTNSNNCGCVVTNTAGCGCVINVMKCN